MSKSAHKLMTAEEYAATPLLGWHEVCRDVDGCGSVGVRFLGDGFPAQQQPSRDEIKGSYLNGAWDQCKLCDDIVCEEWGRWVSKQQSDAQTLVAAILTRIRHTSPSSVPPQDRADEALLAFAERLRVSAAEDGPQEQKMVMNRVVYSLQARASASPQKSSREQIVNECINAIAGVMRIDPKSAGGPFFDALRAVAHSQEVKAKGEE